MFEQTFKNIDDVLNPNGGNDVALRTSAEVLDEIAALYAESAEVMASIRGLI